LFGRKIEATRNSKWQCFAHRCLLIVLADRAALHAPTTAGGDFAELFDVDMD
jgi:hypothetical protein